MRQPFKLSESESLCSACGAPPRRPEYHSGESSFHYAPHVFLPLCWPPGGCCRARSLRGQCVDVEGCAKLAEALATTGALQELLYV